MSSNQISDASRMLVFLKKEEAIYKPLLQRMEQQYVRLQIEELALKAAIRQEQMKIDGENHKEDKTPNLIVPDIVQKESWNNDIPSPEIHEQNLNSDILHTDSSYEYYDHLAQSTSNLKSSEAHDVYSNITDDRYLEPLILNPNSYGDDNLIEFDD